MNAPDEERIERLRRAVVDEGPRPNWHRAITVRHRQEWPALWAAIDDLLWPGTAPEISELRGEEP